MKLPVIIMLFFGFSYSENKINTIFMARVDSIKEECIAESKANRIQIEKLLQSEDFTEDENLKCFQLCVFVRVNAMTEAGQVSTDLIMSELPVAQTLFLDEIINKCRYVKGKDGCETAHLLWRCFVRSGN